MSPYEQYALDWDRIVEGWLKRIEAEMDAAFKADDEARYRWLALLAGEMRSTRSVMLSTLPRPIREVVEAKSAVSSAVKEPTDG